MSQVRNLVRIFLLLLLASACASRVAPPQYQAWVPSGAWETDDGNRRVLFESSRLILEEEHDLKAMKILDRNPGAIVVRHEGVKETWKISKVGGTLKLEHGAEIRSYHPLSTIPPELDLRPLPLGAPSSLTSEEIQKIRVDLLNRRDLDQAVRKDPSAKEKWLAANEGNSAFLRALVRRVGWIDCERFGKPASTAAILLAKHSSDPRLMQAILPKVEQDVTLNMISAELYSVLYDELLLSLGEKQRYGTQLFEDQAGPYVLPLEDAKNVDDFRKAIGLKPLAEYLDTASKYLYDGKPIRLPREDE